MILRLAILSLACLATVPPGSATERRSEILIEDASPSPENLTSLQDGTVFFGSTSVGTIYRALPGKPKAEAWLKGKETGLTNTCGLLADENTNTLWVCDNAPFGRGQTGPQGLPALRCFNLQTGEAKSSYVSPDGNGVFNDVALATDGTAYVSDTFGGRVLRLKAGGEKLEVWAEGQELRGIDGLAVLGDGSLYTNNFFNGKLFRISVEKDGSSSTVVELKTSATFSRPDGMRASGPKSLLQAEGGGRLTEITIEGDRGEVRVIKDGLAGAAGVSLVGSTAYVLVERKKAVAVPMAVPPTTRTK